ncbi:sensor domain-containing phosphodiesterase [Pseudorhodoferax aquiterrae]|uniref:Sensor domain-containing phosphodiesterase n=1 Tax=Pseudorhodoferax aquiterrae TaxID=747304 RepID=A0ABQ3GAQ2_9BURK|nr:sensor domain-containing phosphodiesterase [Pseudorhodoferax aquiterrae]GHC98492.1 sensor domain-containing phosphodiesterase [Pseudorhodoferax aquiterrae]
MLELLTGASEAERERLLVLEATKLVDSPATEDFDRITRLAAAMFNVPTALISFITHDRQWFKSKVGMEVPETERGAAFCDHAIRSSDVLVVEDAARDRRFKFNRLVCGQPGIRFYAGAPLITQSGHALGSLCIIDTEPRELSEQEASQLKDLAALVMVQIERTVSVGRVHEVTHLPNRAQLRSDLQDLAMAGDPGARALALVDVMSSSQVQSALLALGLPALERSVRVIGSRLGSLLGSDITVYHVSETRFAFMLSVGQQEEASTKLEWIMARMREPFRFDGVAFTLEARCGALMFDAKSDGRRDLLRMATSALVQAGAESAALRWYAADMDVPHRRAYALVKMLPESLENGEFRLVYQPKLDVAKRRFSGVEALLRWSHPVMGTISPAEFVPAIEKTAAIHQLTDWVLEAALAQTAEWQSQGLFITVAVNASAKNLEHPEFASKVREACDRHRVDPKWLHIECTENSVLTGSRTSDTLQEIEKLGVQISLDDFGVGYSNIACLNRLPVSLLKLDRSLVAPIATDFRAWTLAQSLIDFGHCLGYRMLAEGVEDAETYEMLVQAGCDAIQGYFVSRPIEATDLLPFLRAQIPARLLVS